MSIAHELINDLFIKIRTGTKGHLLECTPFWEGCMKKLKLLFSCQRSNRD